MTQETIQAKVQKQFGRSATSYVTSTVHAKGPSLARMVELVQPQTDWHVLDIATGGGHTAIAFAPHVKHVVATDITDEMLAAAEQFSAEKEVTNISFKYTEASDFPFDEAVFDLVTCRVAAHHFPDVYKFLLESARVLNRDGMIAIVDNTVPDGSGGDYINAYEILRDPSHARCLSVEEWEQEMYAAGFDLLHKESSPMPLDFDAWTARMHVSAENRTRLKAMLIQAPDEAKSILTPIFQGDRITFHLEKTILIGRKRS